MMGKYKEKNGESRLEAFIKKAGGFFPDLLDVGVMVGTGNVLGAIDVITGKLKDYSKGDGDMSLEAKKLLYEFETNKNSYALDVFKAEAKDRENSRLLYSKDSFIQKLFAVIFLIGYGLLSWYLLQIVTMSVQLPKLAETLVTMIWTGTSTKLSTIIDFLFGGSMK